MTKSPTSLRDQFLGLEDLGGQRAGQETSGQPRLVHPLLSCKRPLLLCRGGELEDSNDLLDGLSDGHHNVVPGEREREQGWLDMIFV